MGSHKRAQMESALEEIMRIFFLDHFRPSITRVGKQSVTVVRGVAACLRHIVV